MTAERVSESFFQVPIIVLQPLLDAMHRGADAKRLQAVCLGDFIDRSSFQYHRVIAFPILFPDQRLDVDQRFASPQTRAFRIQHVEKRVVRRNR